jgi:vanillin dehydrogenase
MNNAAFELIDGFRHHKLFIDGRWVRSSRDQLTDDINPATGKIFARIQQAGAEEVKLFPVSREFRSGNWT